MNTFIFANNVNTQLASAAFNTATTLSLSSSANLPTLATGQYMPLTLNDAATGQIYEVVYVTAISGTTLTVLRAQEGTGAQNWAIGDYAFSTQTAQTSAAVNGNPLNAFQGANATASNQFVNLGQFASLNSSSGYQKLASGLIIQWGTFTTTTAYSNWTFPIAFPTGLLQVFGTPQSTTASIAAVLVNFGASTTTYANVALSNSANALYAGTISLLAIGY